MRKRKAGSVEQTLGIWRRPGRKLATQPWCCLDYLWIEVLISPTATHLTQAEHIETNRLTLKPETGKSAMTSSALASDTGNALVHTLSSGSGDRSQIAG